MTFTSNRALKAHLQAKFPPVKGFHVRQVDFIDLAREKPYFVTADNWAGCYHEVKTYCDDNAISIKGAPVVVSSC